MVKRFVTNLIPKHPRESDCLLVFQKGPPMTSKLFSVAQLDEIEPGLCPCCPARQARAEPGNTPAAVEWGDEA